MQKLDKIFAGLIIVAMVVFWVAMTPATITAKIAEAKPTPVEVPVVIEPEKVERRIVPTRLKQRQVEPRLSDAQLARLKRRDRDTPAEARRQMMQGLDQPMPEGEIDPSSIRNFDEIPDYPTFN